MNKTNKYNLRFVGSASRESVLDIYYPESRSGTPLLIFAHGFKGFKGWGHFPLLSEYFSRNGFCVVSFNFSHNGGTPENPIDFPDLTAFSENTYSKEVEDIRLLLNWVTKYSTVHFSGIDLNRIYLLGHSRGGGIAMLAGCKFNRIKKVVSWAGVADFEKRLPNIEELEKWKEEGIRFIKNGRTKQDMPMKYSFVEDLHENLEELNIKQAVKQMDKPLCLIHGKEDETVHFSAAEELEIVNSKAKLSLIEGANHTFNGKHPWEKNELPKETLRALQETLTFLKS